MKQAEPESEPEPEPEIVEHIVERRGEHKPSLRQRAVRRVGKWIANRLQKRAEREWAEYDHSPKVSFGPLRRTNRGDAPVYRSLVQIHFHPRGSEPH